MLNTLFGKYKDRDRITADNWRRCLLGLKYSKICPKSVIFTLKYCFAYLSLRDLYIEVFNLKASNGIEYLLRGNPLSLWKATKLISVETPNVLLIQMGY